MVENEIPFIFIMFGRELGPEKSACEQRERKPETKWFRQGK